MSIIDAWVDESQVKAMAASLLAPVPVTQKTPESADQDFAVAPEASQQQITQAEAAPAAALDPVIQEQQAEVERAVRALTQTQGPVISESSSPDGKSRAVSVLAKAKAAADKAGVLSAGADPMRGRFGKALNIDEEQGWGTAQVSEELKQHLGESAGAMTNQQAVRSSLDNVADVIRGTFGASEFSISDRDGDVFMDTMLNQAWTKLTVSVTEPIRLLDIQQGAIGHGYIHLKVTAAQVLQVVVTSTSHGLLIFGMLRDKALRSPQVKEFVAKVRELI